MRKLKLTLHPNQLFVGATTRNLISTHFSAKFTVILL